MHSNPQTHVCKPAQVGNPNLIQVCKARKGNASSFSCCCTVRISSPTRVRWTSWQEFLLQTAGTPTPFVKNALSSSPSPANCMIKSSSLTQRKALPAIQLSPHHLHQEVLTVQFNPISRQSGPQQTPIDRHLTQEQHHHRYPSLLNALVLCINVACVF